MSTENLLTFPPDPAAAPPNPVTAPAGAAAELRRDLSAAGRKLWLAGLGLLGELADLDAASRRWADGLVERGRPLAERQRRAADRLADRANTRLAGAGRRLEAEARERAAATLVRLGVPARQDVERLSALLATLEARIDAMTDHPSASHETAPAVPPTGR
jgi:poly(hydroxyalkanoate) granule-associated protein